MKAANEKNVPILAHNFITPFSEGKDEMAMAHHWLAEAAGLTVNKDIFTVGIDGNQPTLDLLKENKFSATLGVGPFRMGVAVIDSMEKILNGEDVSEILLNPIRRRES
jgi:ABC-type sugar transport system substrate-binding protein